MPRGNLSKRFGIGLAADFGVRVLASREPARDFKKSIAAKRLR